MGTNVNFSQDLDIYFKILVFIFFQQIKKVFKTVL